METDKSAIGAESVTVGARDAQVGPSKTQVGDRMTSFLFSFMVFILRNVGIPRFAGGFGFGFGFGRLVL